MVPYPRSQRPLYTLGTEEMHSLMRVHKRHKIKWCTRLCKQCDVGTRRSKVGKKVLLEGKLCSLRNIVNLLTASVHVDSYAYCTTILHRFDVFCKQLHNIWCKNDRYTYQGYFADTRTKWKENGTRTSTARVFQAIRIPWTLLLYIKIHKINGLWKSYTQECLLVVAKTMHKLSVRLQWTSHFDSALCTVCWPYKKHGLMRCFFFLMWWLAFPSHVVIRVIR